MYTRIYKEKDTEREREKGRERMRGREREREIERKREQRKESRVERGAEGNRNFKTICIHTRDIEWKCFCWTCINIGVEKERKSHTCIGRERERNVGVIVHRERGICIQKETHTRTHTQIVQK